MFFKKKKESVKEEKVYEIWEVMEKFGLYQITQYLCICLPTLFATMANINYIFVVGDVDHRCLIPECEDENTTFKAAWWPNKTIDRCSKPVLLNNTVIDNCTIDEFGDELQECHEWVYENQDTVVPALNLACRPWEINSVGTVHNLGMLVAMLVAGYISDRYGRKPILVFCMVAICIGLVKVFATSFNMYISLELLEALVTGGSYSAATVLMIEITGKKHRILSGMIFSYSIYMGETVFASIAMVVPYWKHLIAIIYSPPILCLSLIFFLHESPRWLVLNGKTEEAIKNLKYFAKVNKIKVNTTDVSASNLREKFNLDNYEKKEGLKEVFQSREMMKRLLVAAACRFTSNFVYYGLMINSVWLPGDKYTNFLLSTVMSFPGELLSLYLMNKIGRKPPLLVGFILSGLLCVVSALVPDSIGWAKVLLFLLSKVVVALCFTGAITYCLELFPTSARGSLLGLCAFAARVGGMLAPMTPVLNVVSVMLPAVLFGISAVITGLLILLTPETKNTYLMDTIEQVEASMKANKKSTVNPADNFAFRNDECTQI